MQRPLRSFSPLEELGLGREDDCEALISGNIEEE
jgi:hypothetical protein